MDGLQYVQEYEDQCPNRFIIVILSAVMDLHFPQLGIADSPMIEGCHFLRCLIFFR